MKKFLFVTNTRFNRTDYLKSIAIHTLSYVAVTLLMVPLMMAGITGVFVALLLGLWLVSLLAISVSGLMTTHARLKDIGYNLVVSWIIILIINVCTAGIVSVLILSLIPSQK